MAVARESGGREPSPGLHETSWAEAELWGCEARLVSQAQARPSTWPQPVSVLTEENQAAATDQVDKSSILVIKQSLKLTDSMEDHQLYPSVNEENSWLLLII